MPWMVTCDAFDSTQKESTTPKGVAFTLHLSPRVASYRRQPRAIESTTPVGLSTPLAFATEWNRADGIRYCHLPMSEMRILSTTLPFANKQICTNCPQHHNAQPNNIVSISAQHPYFAQHITRGLHTTSLLINKWNCAHCYDIILHNQMKSRGLYTNYYSQHHDKVTIVTLVSPSPSKVSSLLGYNMHWVSIFFYIGKHNQTGWRNGDSARIAGGGICLWERIVWWLQRIMSPDAS